MAPNTRSPAAEARDGPSGSRSTKAGINAPNRIEVSRSAARTAISASHGPEHGAAHGGVADTHVRDAIDACDQFHASQLQDQRDREKWPARRGRLRQPWQRAGDHESGGCGDADGAQERVRTALDERVPDRMQQRTRQNDAMDRLMLTMGAVRSQFAKWSNECNA